MMIKTNKKNGLFLIFLTLLLSSGVVQAQKNYSITGKVIDGSNKNSLPGATVLIKDSGKGVTTNIDGSFVISGIKEDRIVILTSYIGY